MARTTKKDAIGCAKRISNNLGKKFGNCYVKTDDGYKSVVGCWDFDYNATYGGGVITEIVSEGGGITHPLGSRRQKPAAFCEQVWFAENALDVERKRK